MYFFYSNWNYKKYNNVKYTLNEKDCDVTYSMFYVNGFGVIWIKHREYFINWYIKGNINLKWVRNPLCKMYCESCHKAPWMNYSQCFFPLFLIYHLLDYIIGQFLERWWDWKIETICNSYIFQIIIIGSLQFLKFKGKINFDLKFHFSIFLLLIWERWKKIIEIQS